MSIHKKRRKVDICHNCRTQLQEENNFCPSCGQENHDLKVSIGHLAFEVFEGFTHFDTKFYNTFRAIFLYPGKITKDFLEGRRSRYVPPVRLYFLISFIFFLVMDLLVDKALVKSSDAIKILLNEKTDTNLSKKVVAKNQLLLETKKLNKTLEEAVKKTDSVNINLISDQLNENKKALKLLEKIDNSTQNNSFFSLLNNITANGIMDEMNIAKDDTLRILLENLSASDQQNRLIEIQKQIILDSDNTEIMEDVSPRVMNYFTEKLGNKRQLIYSLNPFVLKNNAKINVKYDQDTLITITGGNGDIQNAKYHSSIIKMNDAALDSLIEKEGTINFMAIKLINRGFARNLAYYNLIYYEDPEKSISQLAHLAVGVFSLMMFFLMPIVALLLKAIYSQRSHSIFSFPIRLFKYLLDYVLTFIGLRRQHRYRHFPHFMAGHTRYYYEHLIFSIHIHAIFFLMILIFVGIGVLLGIGGIAFALTMLGFFLYFILSLKRVYRQGMFKTLIKSLILFLLYFSSFTFVLIITASIKFALS